MLAALVLGAVDVPEPPPELPHATAVPMAKNVANQRNATRYIPPPENPTGASILIPDGVASGSAVGL
jgi:hypothetical protein